MTGPAGIEVEQVTRHLRAEVALQPPLTFEQVAGGRSNLTFVVTDATGRRVILRRPPLHGVLASAHDVGREARIMAALSASPVPVPQLLARCDDETVTGAPFIVLEHVTGNVLRDRAAVEAHLPRADRAAMGDAVVDTLATLHSVTPGDVGLGELGRHDGYVERQLRRWLAQSEQLPAAPPPELHGVHARLAGRVPAQQKVSVAHGDYRLDNLIVRDNQVRAVLDWELCTLGDPLADLGLLLAYWSHPGEFGALDHPPTTAPGFPDREAVVLRYARRSGLDCSDVGFYFAFALWKIAAIMLGVHARYTAGGYGRMDDGVEQLPQRIAALLRQATVALDSDDIGRTLKEALPG